jgi:hypothetical protein
MTITKQKRNLINELSCYLLNNIQTEEELKEVKKIVCSAKYYTNKQIKILINDFKQGKIAAGYY